jgi:phage recombination protein Bet
MSNEITTAQPQSLLAKVASRYSVEPAKMLTTLKATAFKGEVSNEQMMALLIVADQYGLNPWTKEIYAFPDKQNGVVPVVGVDGWARIINSNDKFDGMSFAFSDNDTACTCTIHRKDRSHPIEVTEYLSECRRNTGPWGSHPRRMLRHKAMVQCARLAFGFVGIYDHDEAERIVEAEGVQVVTAPKVDESGMTGTEKLKARIKAKATSEATDVPAAETVNQETGEIEQPKESDDGMGQA